MFIDVVPNGRSAPAVLLRESYREGKRVRKRTLANLSGLPPALIDGLRVLLRGGKVVGSAEEALEIRRALPHGHVLAALSVIRDLGLERLLDRTPSRQRSLAIALIALRVVAPSSKLAAVRALSEETATTSLGHELGLGAIKEAEIYAALDWLGERQAKVERALTRRHLVDGTLVLYDVSSSYLEGRCCELAQHGYSRDRRPDRPQIVYGLLCDRQGRPLAVEVFAGDTADPATLGAQIDKLKRRFGLKHVVLVGDRGMVTSARIRDELRPAGLDWITSLRAPQIQALAEEGGPLQLTLFDERNIAEIASPDYPGERLVLCRNPELARERGRKRAELLAATERELERIARMVRRKHAPLRGKAEIGMAVGAVLDRHRMAKHFTLTITEDSLSWQRDEARIAREARLDGIYVIRTSVSAAGRWTRPMWCAPTRTSLRSSGPSVSSRGSICRSARSITGLLPGCGRMCSSACLPTTSSGTCERTGSHCCWPNRTTTPPKRPAPRRSTPRWSRPLPSASARHAAPTQACQCRATPA